MPSKIGPKELALKAQRETKGTKAVRKAVQRDDGNIPEFLKRIETIEQSEARAKRHAKPDKSAGVALAPELPPLATRKAIAKDLAEKVDKVSWPEFSPLPSTTTLADVKRDHRIASAKKAKKLPKPDPMERKLAEALAKKEVSIPKQKHTNGSGKKTKVQIVADLLQRKEGCTTADVLNATGWPSVSMPQQAKAAGLKLKKEKDGSVTRYRA